MPARTSAPPFPRSPIPSYAYSRTSRSMGERDGRRDREGPVLGCADPITPCETILGDVRAGDRVNLEADLFVKSARELHAAARLVASRSVAALPWSGGAA